MIRVDQSESGCVVPAIVQPGAGAGTASIGHHGARASAKIGTAVSFSRSPAWPIANRAGMM